MEATQRQFAASPVSLSATDAELASLAAQGSEAAFETIMRRHNRLLFRTARGILKNDAEAEDALQEAYLRAWRALDSFRGDAKLSTWLVRIVMNESLGRLRRYEAQVIPMDVTMEPISLGPDMAEALQDDVDQHPDRIAMREEMRQLMEAHIDMLPDVFRSVFVLRGVEELSVQEVAEALAIPEATVRTRFFRARSLLREGLSREVDMAIADAFSFDGDRCDRIVARVRERLAAMPQGRQEE